MVKKVVVKTVKTTIDDGKKKKTTTKKTTSGSKKKSVKKVAKKKPVVKTVPKSDVSKRDEILIDNFVGLQHAMTNLSIKFGELSQNISKLLTVFESAAKELARSEKQVDVSFERKLDSLIDQNKTIAKGLVLMDGKMKAQMSRGPAPETQRAQPMAMPQSPVQGSTAPQFKTPLPAPQGLQFPQGSPSFPQAPVNKPKPLPQL